MPNTLSLIPKTLDDVSAMLDAMTPADRAQVSPDWLARVYSPAPPDHWTLGYTLVLADGGEEVGHCGFKAPPCEGVVEIAYGVAPEHEGKGYATEAARALVAIAFQSDEVRRVIVHTLDPSGASSRVLSKAGFTRSGQVIDPEDGPVWRWEMDRDDAVS